MITSATATIEGTGTKPADVVVRGNASGFLQEIVSGAHQLRADEPVSVGGGDAAPGPYDYLLIGLGGMHIDDGWLVRAQQKVAVAEHKRFTRHSRIHAKDCAECETKDGDARPGRCRDRIEWPVDAGTACETDGDRGQMPGSSHPKIGD